jgi:hypothetical protein
VRHHVLLDRLEVLLHLCLGMLVLECGNQRGDERRSKVTLDPANLGGKLLQELLLVPQHRTEFLQDQVLTSFQILALGVAEALDLLWGHHVATAHRHEHNVAQSISLDGKPLGMCHAAQCLLTTVHLACVFCPQLALFGLKAFLTKGSGQHRTHVGHQACHVLPQALPLPRSEGKGLGLIGCAEIMHVYPIAWRR